MKLISLLPAWFLGTTDALFKVMSARQGSEPRPECPESWSWRVASLSGPGCPDNQTGFNLTHGHTSESWGSHFVEGCHTPWIWWAFPYLQASISEGSQETSTFCELTIKYREMEGSAYPQDIPLDEAKYKLVMHRNGTTMEARYALDEGVSARWKFTYWYNLDNSSQLTDEIVVRGPLHDQNQAIKMLHWSEGRNKNLDWVSPQCGIAYQKIRVELELQSNSPGARGAVLAGWTAPLMGVSHDFVPCYVT